MPTDRELIAHPYWCDCCNGKAAFTIPGCEIDHTKNCDRFGEDAMEIYNKAVAYCKKTGNTIK